MGDILRASLATLASQSRDFQTALRLLIKYEVYTLLQRLSDVGEEAVVITASPDDGANGHLGSNRGEDFLRQSQTIHSLQDQFLVYCRALRNVQHGGDNTSGSGSLHDDTGITIVVKDEPDTGDAAATQLPGSPVMPGPSIQVVSTPGLGTRDGPSLQNSLPSVQRLHSGNSMCEVEQHVDTITTLEPALYVAGMHEHSSTNLVRVHVDVSTGDNQLMAETRGDSVMEYDTCTGDHYSNPSPDSPAGPHSEGNDVSFTVVKTETVGDPVVMAVWTPARTSVDTPDTFLQGNHAVDVQLDGDDGGTHIDDIDTYEDIQTSPTGQNAAASIEPELYAVDDPQRIILKAEDSEVPSPTSTPVPPIDYFFCDDCIYSTMEKAEFEAHLQTCIEAQNLTCLFCSSLFTSMEELQTHISALHQESRPVSRELVQTVPIDRNIIVSDSARRKGAHACVNQYRCRQCTRMFMTKPSLKKHVYKQHMWKCLICKLPFRSRELMLNHWSSRHIECKICDKRFLTKQTLRKHEMRFHTPAQQAGHDGSAAAASGKKSHGIRALTHRCKICRKKFDRGLFLKRHMLTQHNESQSVQRTALRSHTLDPEATSTYNNQNNETSAYKIRKSHIGNGVLSNKHRMKQHTANYFSHLREKPCMHPGTDHADHHYMNNDLIAKEPSVVLEPLSENTLEELRYQGGACNVGMSMLKSPRAEMVLESLGDDKTNKTAAAGCTGSLHDKSTVVGSYKNVDALYIPTKCLYCEKMFQFRTIMMRHMKKCREAKHYICKICCMSFSNEYSLTTHTTSHAKDSTQTQYVTTTSTNLLKFRIQENIHRCVSCDCVVDTIEKHIAGVHMSEPSSIQGNMHIVHSKVISDSVHEITMGYTDTGHGIHSVTLTGTTNNAAQSESQRTDFAETSDPKPFNKSPSVIKQNIPQPDDIPILSIPYVFSSPKGVEDAPHDVVIKRMDSFLKMKRIAPVSTSIESTSQQGQAPDELLTVDKDTVIDNTTGQSTGIHQPASVLARELTNEILIDQETVDINSLFGLAVDNSENSDYPTSADDSVGETLVLCDSCGGLCDADLVTGHTDTCEHRKERLPDTHILDTECDIVGENCEKFIVEAPKGRKLKEPNKHNLFDCFICEKVLSTLTYLVKHRKNEHPNIILVPYGKKEWKKRKLAVANAVKTVVKVPSGKTIYKPNQDMLFDCFICKKALCSFETAKWHRRTKHPNVVLVPYGRKRWMEQKLAAEKQKHSDIIDKSVSCHETVGCHGTVNCYQTVSCPYCHLEWKRKHLLQKHVEEVHEVKEHVTLAKKPIKHYVGQKCLYCQMVAGTSLKERARHYMGEHADMPVAKAFKAHFCPYCDYGFCKNYFILLLHVVGKHKKEGVQFRSMITYDTCKFKCHICYKGYFKWTQLCQHMSNYHKPNNL